MDQELKGTLLLQHSKIADPAKFNVCFDVFAHQRKLGSLSTDKKRQQIFPGLFIVKLIICIIFSTNIYQQKILIT